MDKRKFLTLKAYRLPFLITFLLAYNITVKAQIIPEPPTNPVERTSADLDFENAFSVNGVNFHAQFGWEHSLWQQRVQDFNYGMMRFQGGDVSKHTCWSTGKFFIPNTNTTDPCLWIPEDLRNSMLNTNLTMENTPDMVAKSTHLSGTSIMADLNMFTSYPSHEFAMLMKFQQLNVPVTRVEIQQESYNTKCENMLLWPQPLDYAIMADSWMAKMRTLWDLDNSNTYNKNNNYSFSIVGNKPFEFNTQRRAKWDAQVQGHFAAYPKDYGVTMHPYFGANLLSLDIFNPGADIDDMMIQPFRYNNASIVPAIAQVDNYSSKEPDILLTEGNMYQTKGVVHGSWAAALFTGVAYLKFMENPRIKTLLHHGFSGDFAWADFFNSTDGYNQGEFDAPKLASTNMIPSTNVGQVTLQGHVMKMINKCFKGATHAKMIDFASLNSLSGPCPVNTYQKIDYPLMYGWKFDNGSTNQEQIILFNLSDAPQTVDLQLYTNNTSFIGEQINFGFDTYLGATLGNETIFNFNPLGFLVPTSWNGVFEKQLNTVGNIINIPQYTILRLYTTTNTNPTLRTVPAANYCTGAPISIVVDNPQNFINYVWSSGCTQGSPHVAQVNPTSTPTTYTVTVTDAGGLTHTTTIVVQGTPNNLSFNIPTTTYNTCANIPIQIKATLQNGQAANFASYALYADQAADPGFANKQSDGYKFISNGSQFTQYVMPKKTTDYYIMASDGKCAKQSAKITVNVAPYADLGPDKEFCTTGTGIILYPYEEQIPPANVNYNWSTGSTSPTLSVSTAGTYTVTVTDVTNGCTTTDNIVLTPISCCNNTTTDVIIPPNTIIDKGYVNSSLSINTTNGLTVISPKVLPAKQNLEIQGTIHIMDNVRLQNFATINCSEAAQIDVRPYSRFGIFDSYVKSCTNYLWKGIDVKRFGDLVIKSVNKLCKITEAEFGVTIRKDCTIEIEDIDFVDNFVGLFVPPTINFELANDVDITITGSRFYCDNNLKLAYGGLSPQISNYVPKTVSLAGMVLNQTASSIGVSLQNYNQFGNSNTSKPKMNYGIIAYNSALNVQATMFQNIADIDKYGKLGGTSIYSSNQYGYGSLIETGLGKQNSTPTISNSYRSIYIDHGTATIKQNFISSCDFGPTLYYSPGGNSLFESNKIITRIASLWLSYNFNANLVETKLNQYLNANYVPNNIISAGIVVLEPDKFTKLIMHESQYILGGAYTKYGMYISMVHGAVIGCHDIDLSLTLQSNMSLGMYVARGGDNDLRRITIKGNGNYSYCNTEGMHFLSSTNNIIRCNATNNNRYGFVFDGVCTMPERFKTNEIKNAYEGLHVSSEGLMDNQTNTGNTWTGSFTNYGANNERINKYLSTTDVVKYSISGTNNLPLLPPNQIGWFVQSTASDATCDTASCVYIKPIIGDGETATDIAIASGTIGFPQFEEEMIHAAEQQEAENLSLNQDSIDNDTLLTFLNNYRNSNNGIFQLINDTILNIVDNNKIQFAFNDSIVRYNLQIVAEYDSIIVDSLSSSLTISNARIIKLQLLNEVNQLLHQNQLYSQQYQTNLGSRVNIALQMNNAVNTFGKTYISNEKTVNEMFLLSLLQQVSEYTSAQWQTLKGIAAQCPHTGGKGVIKARNLILSKCDSIFWDDAPTCALEGYWRKAKKEGVDDIVILSPNPAKYYTDLLYKTNDDIALTLKVLDNYGQVIFVKQLNQNQNSERINTSELANGCYQIALFSAVRKVSCQKLIILK